MKKNLVRFAIFFSIFFCNPSFAETYYFKGCKLSNVATGDYIINLDKKTVQATLKATDGRTQTLYDKIKTVDKFQIITEKIESGKGNNVFFARTQFKERKEHFADIFSKTIGFSGLF